MHVEIEFEHVTKFIGLIIKEKIDKKQVIEIKVFLDEDKTDTIKIKSIKDTSSNIDIDVFLQKLDVGIKDIKAK